MYTFIKEQKVFDVGGVKFGGQPGEYPTVLFGTVFYGKQFKSLDEQAFELTGQYVQQQEKLSSLTGVPGLPDVYIRSVSDVDKELDYILNLTDGPFSIDSSEAQTRAAALKYLSNAGALERVIYNSLNLGVTEEEVKALEKYPPECILALAYNPKDMGVDGRAQILVDGAGMLCVGGGLLDIVESVGVEKILLDTGATPFGSMGCETLRAIPVFKNRFGLPTGCSIHNTLESWPWMKDYRRENQSGYDCANAAANAMVPLCCGDYIVYGPVSSAPGIFPAIAFADKLMAEGAADYFGLKPSVNHPYKRL
ncbi:MAG: tetrahydromethanopterin S-methyltransferase subunit H [Candidatus Altiarchaeota archaeon]|nr:tetrahydromethanopterin S-methyltransferase subunit H [Candidatus Altiarchaeota archaeon]